MFKYLGTVKGQTTKWENGTLQKNSGGDLVDVEINSSEAASMKIPEGPLKYGDTLTHFLNITNLYRGNVLNDGLNLSHILAILQYT
jgi:hypothetical protein